MFEEQCRTEVRPTITRSIYVTPVDRTLVRHLIVNLLVISTLPVGRTLVRQTI
jgi:hypothetical protein